MAIIAILVILRWTAHHGAWLGQSVYTLLDGATTFVTDHPIAWFGGTLIRWLILAALPFVLAWVFFERGKLPSRSLQAYGRLMRWSVRQAWRLIVPVSRFIFSLVIPRRSKAPAKERS